MTSNHIPFTFHSNSC